MFKNTFQSGFLSLLYSIGYPPFHPPNHPPSHTFLDQNLYNSSTRTVFNHHPICHFIFTHHSIVRNGHIKRITDPDI